MRIYGRFRIVDVHIQTEVSPRDLGFSGFVIALKPHIVILSFATNNIPEVTVTITRPATSRRAARNAKS